MVTPIQPVLPGSPIKPTETAFDKSSRAISEAQRLLIQNKITGADAMRITSMISMAQKSQGSGKLVEAHRAAKEAVQIASQYGDGLTPVAKETDKADSVSPGKADDEKDDRLPASESMGDEDGGLFDPKKTTYTDGSDDSGISFQYAQPISDIQAPFAVRQHEISHVRRDTQDAIINGQKVMSSVTVRHRIDETGSPFIDGGRARILIFPKKEIPQIEKGQFFDHDA
jgi:hypothetical protein